MNIQLRHTYQEIIGLENLLAAWEEFRLGKRDKPDVQAFVRHLLDNIVQLHEDLANFTYRHGGYKAFAINDPKPRQIHKASVRDRLLHHVIYRILYPFFDRTFIADSFSCRVDKGTLNAIERFQTFGYQVSRNNTRTCWVLKCDIRKFFANINHGILLQVLARYLPDQNILWLLENVIDSFDTKPGVGLSLGNLTSQLFVNVYMNEFDQFVKQKMRWKHYIRYADDFAFLSDDRTVLAAMLPMVDDYLVATLQLQLHPDKVFIKTLASGVDFLGWVHFLNHRVLRTTARWRMMARIKEHGTPETVQSYLGLLQHGNTYRLEQEVRNAEWLWYNDNN
ncbi:MAG: reverse transcriptase/maturase family protein [bacterium]